jgi:hypothetical protein
MTEQQVAAATSLPAYLCIDSAEREFATMGIRFSERPWRA